jgi:hypothetical protein
MDSLEPQTRNAAINADSSAPLTHRKPGARGLARVTQDSNWIVVDRSSAPSRRDSTRARARPMSSSRPQRRRPLRVSPTWQPNADASLKNFYPGENPRYPRIPKAPKLPSEFDGVTPSSPSIAPQLFDAGSYNGMDDEPAMWPSVRRVWTWLRGAR